MDNTINKKETQAHFDNIALNYNVNDHKGNIDKSNVFFSKLLPSQSAPNILECGGGGGLYTLKLLQSGYNVTTVDISEKALEVNKENAKQNGYSKKLTTFAGDFNVIIPELNTKFDQIIFIKVLHHFDNLKEINMALETAHKHLNKNGKIIIFEPNGKNLLWEIFLKLQKDPITKRPKWEYEKNLKLTTVKNLTKHFKTEDIDFKVYYKFVIPAFMLSKINLFTKILMKVNLFLEKTFFKYFSFNVLIEIDK